MCGIVGVLGLGPVQNLIVEALKRLEYRGYDSAGIACLENGKLSRRRASGKLRNLEERLAKEPLAGSTGIGHTRWATHGKATENNAHPHATDKIAVVHNGIIENFRELREELRAKGRHFASQTDSEVIAHLVTQSLDEGLSPIEAVAASLPRLKGAFAFAMIFAGEDNLLIGASQGAPLAVGFGEDDRAGEMFLGSDALALAPFTQQVAYLEDGDMVVLTHDSASFRDASGLPVERRRIRTQASAFLIDKGNHRHFMAKEIHEQPEVVGRTLGHYLDMSSGHVALPFELPVDPATLSRLTICGCGTAYFSALMAKYWFERFARLPVDVEIASEFRYRDPPLDPSGLTIVVSQSGETADTLAALRCAKGKGQKILAIVNVASSTMSREADVVAPTLAGPEIGVASTKAFTCQLAVFAALALAFGRARGVLGAKEEARLIGELMAVPGLMAQALKCESAIEGLAREIGKVRDVLYLGRGAAYPLALEGALKLKEISYIHAEGYAAGELKHGPIALIDGDMPVIVIAPKDAVLEKTISNMQEVAARGGRLILIGDENLARDFAGEAEASIIMPEFPADFAGMVYAIPIQLIAYHTAVVMGKDADQPRNLAKSVTVE
ncbi:glucosamine/fructose-6-phosphate aminotransferase, isomerizing [Methylocella silvestris BL2]|uniref:Glutamine--fructose-6-phosphate aminotransferase [isomerizing] n=1 Tax=Methylocella silvestris (strain DSM 15510 / CIP 108128 / LMG 27833 / NCIMB 13906 / BL2) TaxID=395965 RepID=B8EP91_METSB|nr:glutamine--fructose-6-phosphate transaminase (isomerizing) [Methylocella silvestris]ACK49679.1 glucosamine/fructose-6-phosphate aminotransferase, isomerizing [Methylocella silvestris BL2]